MNFSAIILLCLVGGSLAAGCPGKKPTSKLVCYYSKLIHVDPCKCTHVILPADSDVKNIDRVREKGKGVKILITVNEFNQGLVDILKSSKVDGVEINLKKLDSKNDINDFISTVRSRLGSDLQIVLSVPAKNEILAKYYDFKTLSKHAELFILQTGFLGASKNVTFHPSRLSGLWDMQNTDSVVDLVTGLGAPLSKLVITSPVQAFKFKLQSEKHTAPGSPALEVQSLTRDDLCDVMKNGANWTLERDQDQTGPYIFSKNQWIAFDDATSIDIKAKYTRIRGLAGMALKDVSQDGTRCEGSLLEAAYQGLSRQARAPRGAVLHSLEREILETPVRPVDTVQVSPYRISRVIDVEGNVHVIRKDTRTEFECSRQGYFVHPRSCGRFYRCVKFNQLSDEFSVFEFDCPAGLAFDSRVEVCVWPGSLPHASPCSGSSEIAPVPRERFICPTEPGYYADPENCRWFFACLDHGKSPLSAYEFRCPFGLVYDESRLLCEWPWLVPKCGSGYAVASQVVYGGSAVALDQYDGLGVLGVTTLGGLHGPLQQPEAKVYSNVGLASQGDAYALGGGQLSLKAAQSLQNAGLLRNDYNIQGAGFGYLGGNANGNLALKNTQTIGLGLVSAGSGVATSGLSTGSLGGSYNYQSGSSHASGAAIASDLRNSLNYQDSSSYSSNLNHGAGIATSGLSTGSLGGSFSYQSGSSQASGAEIASNLQNSLNAGSNYQTGSSYSTNLNQGEGIATTDLKTGSLGGSFSYQSGSSQASGAEIASNLQNSLNAGLNYQTGSSYSTNLNQGEGIATTDLKTGSLGGSFSYQSGSSQASGAEIASNLQNSLNAGLNYQTGSSYSTNLNQGEGIATTDLKTGSLGGSFSYQSGSSQASGAEIASNLRNSLNAGSNYQTGSSYSTNLNQATTDLKTGSLGGSFNYQASGADISSNLQNSNLNYQTGSSYSTNLNQGSSGLSKGSLGGSFNHQSDSSHAGGVEIASDIRNSLDAGLNYQTGSSYSTTLNHGAGIGSSDVATSSLGGSFNYQSSGAEIASSNSGSSFGAGFNYQSGSSQSAITKGAAVASTDSLGTNYNYQSGQHTSGVGIASDLTNTFGAGLSYQSGSTHSTSGGYVGTTNAHLVNGLADNLAVSREGSSVEYHGNSDTGISGNINIIGGGYSAVGVQVSNRGEDSNVVTHVTQSPVSVIPTVTAVPVPAIKVASGFESYNGGVVANVPELQYKFASRGNSGFANVSNTFVNIASSTPATVPATGYQYPKPTVAFIEEPIKATLSTVHQNVANIQPVVSTTQVPLVQSVVTTYQKPTTFVQTPIVEQRVTTYQKPVFVSTTPAPVVIENVNIQQDVKDTAFVGYDYPKPAVKFEETPVRATGFSYVDISHSVSSTPRPVVQQPVVAVQPQLEVTSYNVPSSTPRPVIVQQPQVYVSSTPATVPVVQQQAVSFTNVQKHATVQAQAVQPAVVSSFSISSNNGGYHYDKPSIAFEERPVTYQQPSVVQQPAVTYTNIQKHDTVQPQLQVTSYNVPSSTPKPLIVQQTPTVYVASTPATVVQQKLVQPAVVSSFSISSNNGGYHYDKPSVAFEEKPVVTYQQPAIQKTVISQPVATYNYQQPAVSTYTYKNVLQSGSNQGYTYPKPAIAFEEVPAGVTRLTHKPAVVLQKQQPVVPVSTYTYTAPSTVKPAVVLEHEAPVVTSYTYTAPVKPAVVVQKQRPVVTSYSYTAPSTVKPTVLVQQPYIESSTPKSAVFLQKQAVITYTPKPVILKQQPAVVSSYSFSAQPVQPVEFKGYDYPKPEVQFVEQPAPVVTYDNREPVQEVPFVKKTAYVTTQQQYKPVTVENYQAPVVSSTTPRYQQYSIDSGYVYEKPVVPFVEAPRVVTTSRPIVDYTYVQSTPKPTFSSTIKAIVAGKQPWTFYDSRLTSTVRPVAVSTSLPVVTTSRPISQYSFSSLDAGYEEINDYVAPIEVTTRRVPVTPRVKVAVAPSIVTTSRPIAKYSFSSLDGQYQQNAKIVESYVAPIEVTSPSREYLPVTNPSTIKVTTRPPVTREYLPPQPTVRITTTPTVTREYLPAKVTTSAPSREYLPAKTRVRVESVDVDDLVSTVRPVKVVRVSRPKTIVKVNDFHPLLSAKLGAQCTCVSNNLRLRKKPLRIYVEEDDSDDDGYVVDNDSGTVVENYQYEPQRIVDITPTPEVYIKSTEITSAPEVYIKSTTPVVPVYTRSRVRVRPATSTLAPEPSVETAQDAVVVNAIGNVATTSVESPKFDRYGPGGWRSRDEKLQGTIDCQRAGLFRHPTQCNKFYACRWDCTKNRYTLHVFNCPVHLTFDNNLGACNWPSQGPACLENTLLPSD